MQNANCLTCTDAYVEIVLDEPVYTELNYVQEYIRNVQMILNENFPYMTQVYAFVSALENAVNHYSFPAGEF